MVQDHLDYALVRIDYCMLVCANHYEIGRRTREVIKVMVIILICMYVQMSIASMVLSVIS